MKLYAIACLCRKTIIWSSLPGFLIVLFYFFFFFRLRLRGNRLSCACSSMNFLRWLWTTSVILDGEGSSTRRYTCTTETGDISDTEQTMAAWESYWRRCVGYSVFSLAIALLLLQVGIVNFIAYVIIAFFFSFFFFVVVVVVIFLWDYILPHWLTRFEPIDSESGISMCCPPCHSSELPTLLI